MALRSVDSRFRTRGLAVEKASSPSLSLDECWTRSLLLAGRFQVQPDTRAVVDRSRRRSTGTCIAGSQMQPGVCVVAIDTGLAWPDSYQVH